MSNKVPALLKISRSTITSGLAKPGNTHHPANVEAKVVQLAMARIQLFLSTEKKKKGSRINTQRFIETSFLIINTRKHFNGYQLIKG